MSESHIAIRPGAGVDGLPIPAAPEDSAPDAHVAAPLVTASARRIGSLLRWVFSFPTMLGTFLVGRVFYEGRAFFVDPDLWWHIKVGQNILATHHWPTTDPFSFTVAGTPWMAYEWLGEIVLAVVYRSGGLFALDAFLILLGSIIMLSLYWLASARSGNSKAGFTSAGILCSLAFASFTLRPQMIAYLFLVLTLIALHYFRKGVSWPIWCLPPFFLFWVNVHGSFIIGIGVLAVYLCSGIFSFQLGSVAAIAWTRKQRLQLETTLLLCLAVLPITPYGAQLAVYPFDMAFSQPINVTNILEWRPMPFDILGGKVFLGLVVIFFLLQMFFRFTWRLEELALALGGTVMACLHVRFLLLFVPFFAPLFATLLARWLPRYDRAKEHYVLNAVLMALVITGMVWYFPSTANIREIVARTYPVKAVDYLRQHRVPGPMYNTYGYGGYLIWSRWPEQKVFLDGRGDLYEVGGVLSDYLEVAHLRPAAFAVLRSYGIQSCLLERKEALATVLAARPDWQQAYSDDVSVLFVRRNDSAYPDAVREQGTLAQRE